MDTIASETGSNVIRMPRLDHETLKGIFTEVEMSTSEDLNALFYISELGELSLVRALHSTRNCSSRRLSRHVGSGGKSYIYACMPNSGKIEIDHLGRSCEISSGDITFLSTDHEYSINMSDDLDAFWLRMPASSVHAHSIALHESLCHALQVSYGIGFAAAELMRASTATSEQLSGRGGRLIAQSLLGFLGELMDSTFIEHPSAVSSYRHKIFSRARDYIEENIGNEYLSPEMVAEGIGISRRYLSEIFASEGTSVMRWVQTRRLERCRAEIECNGLAKHTIQEIAYTMGFANISSFNRAFKAKYGRSPRELLNS